MVVATPPVGPTPPAVKVVPVTPAVVELLVGSTEPRVGAKLAGIPFWTVPEPEVSTEAELMVNFDVTAELPPKTTLLGLALEVSVNHVLELTTAEPVSRTPLVVPEQPAPVAPGP